MLAGLPNRSSQVFCPAGWLHPVLKGQPHLSRSWSLQCSWEEAHICFQCSWETHEHRPQNSAPLHLIQSVSFWNILFFKISVEDTSQVVGVIQVIHSVIGIVDIFCKHERIIYRCWWNRNPFIQIITAQLNGCWILWSNHPVFLITSAAFGALICSAMNISISIERNVYRKEMT